MRHKVALACLLALQGFAAMAEPLPFTAVLKDLRGIWAVYINPESDEVSSVWMVNQETGAADRVCVTDPASPRQWERMSEPDSDAVEVPLTQIAAAENAWVCPGNKARIIVEGCPDFRNVWSYIIDVETGRAWQLPTSEGVVVLDLPNQEIIGASYGYDEDGRYTFCRAYSTEGKYLHPVGEKERE